jgi:hypothetical protein
VLPSNGLVVPTLGIRQVVLDIDSTSTTNAQACRVRRCPRLWNNVYLPALSSSSRIADPYLSSTRFIVFNKHAEIIALHQVEFPQYYPHPGSLVSTLLMTAMDD